MSQTPEHDPASPAQTDPSLASTPPAADASAEPRGTDPHSVDPHGADPHGGQARDLEAELAEANDQMRRLAADIDNLRKRHLVELGQARQFAIESFAEALLPAADSLELALSVPNQTPEGLRSGVELTLRQLVQAFEKGRLVAIAPVGEKFDPNRHQAISMVDGAAATPPVPSGHVVQVMQKGYLIGERVLRPALVSVAS